MLATTKTWAQSSSLATGADRRVTFLTTTAAAPWQPGSILKGSIGDDALDLAVDPYAPATPTRAIQGFGACFNELGWTALNALSMKDRESVLRELFHPTEGARFTFCRMPIAASFLRSPTNTISP